MSKPSFPWILAGILIFGLAFDRGVVYVVPLDEAGAELETGRAGDAT